MSIGDFSLVLGVKRSRNIALFAAVILLVLLILSLKEVFILNKILLSLYLLVIIILPLSYFIYLLWNFETKKEFTYASNYLKYIMLFGILSMSLFKL